MDERFKTLLQADKYTKINLPQIGTCFTYAEKLTMRICLYICTQCSIPEVSTVTVTENETIFPLVHEGLTGGYAFIQAKTSGQD
jgi:hypothetical protein